ncbi:MAG: DUF4157 domain-containing protein [Bacteroidia bacterium]|nr:DUF4157 domain-containing protein [Bacteroidia bacterium]
MNTYADKSQEKKSQSVANTVSQKKSSGDSTLQFVDNRPEAIAQRKLQEMTNNSSRVSQLRAFQEIADNSPQVKQAAQLQEMADNYSAKLHQPTQKKENNTGLPDNLKTGIENLSGYSMDDVKVHYNSDKPSQLQAHAYAQGSQIHLGPRQEKHLPHEAWHVVQQKQGRVKPTIQMKDNKVSINDDVGLEKEADVMGAKAFQFVSSHHEANAQRKPIQKKDNVIQMVIDKPFRKYNGWEGFSVHKADLGGGTDTNQSARDWVNRWNDIPKSVSIQWLWPEPDPKDPKSQIMYTSDVYTVRNPETKAYPRGGTWDAGHKLANSSGGSGTSHENLWPQTPSVNQGNTRQTPPTMLRIDGTWKDAERRFNETVRKYGLAEWWIKLNY